MRRICDTLIAASLSAVVTGTSACAASMLVAWPSEDGDQEFSEFSVQFTDKNGNQLLDFDEITVFSGVDQTDDPEIPLHQPYLYGIPAITGISNAGSAPGSNAPPTYWSFSSQSNGVIEISEAPDDWTYQMQLSSDPSPVPLPASAMLLAGSAAVLGALGARRRYRKGEAHR
jgi:hypothetical protein